MFLPPVTLPRRPRPVAFALSVVVACLLLTLIAVGLRRGPIEDDLMARATVVVREHAGYAAAVTFDGRDGVLHGTFPSTQVAEQARSKVATVDGVASARLGDDVRITSAPARPLVVAVEDDVLTVVATVPDRRLRDELLDMAAAASDGALATEVVVDAQAGVPPVGALVGVAAALTATPGEHSVTIEGDSVVLAGAVPDDATASRLGGDVLAATREVLPEATLDNRLTTGGTAGDGTAGDGVAAMAGDAAGTAGSAPGGTVAEQLAAVLADESITFDSGSVALASEDRALLDRIARVLAASDLTVLVAGHSDPNGPLAFNQVLSADRAQSVVAYLNERGVPAQRLRAVGFGADEPVEPNDTAKGRAANRRAEIILLP